MTLTSLLLLSSLTCFHALLSLPPSSQSLLQLGASTTWSKKQHGSSRWEGVSLNDKKLTSHTKSMIIKHGIHSNRTQELVHMNALLFQPPLPHRQAMDEYFKALMTKHPDLVCSTFARVLNDSLASNSDSPISSSSLVFVLKSISRLFAEKKSTLDIHKLFPSNSNPILDIFDYSVQKQMTTIGVIVTSIIAGKHLKDFAGVFSIYTRSKQLAKELKIKDHYQHRLPDIVYGQTVVALAKLGAESQTYQIVCDMLEAGNS